MKFTDLITYNDDILAPHSVPDWMIGQFNRRSISFSNGKTDTSTVVIWMQCRNFSIDLRLPISSEMPVSKRLEEYTELELQQIADYEGWFAHSIWADQQLRWEDAVSLQLHERWPEPALLKRVGNCMIEFAPSGAYVEEWRFRNRSPGPLVGLPLHQEKNLNTGEIVHRGGGLIVCGDFAGLVLGRVNKPGISNKNSSLKDLLDSVSKDKNLVRSLLGFECSVARKNPEGNFTIFASTVRQREGEDLFCKGSFEFIDKQMIRHTFYTGQDIHERIFTIDSIEKNYQFSYRTSTNTEVSDRFEREKKTLSRYCMYLD